MCVPWVHLGLTGIEKRFIFSLRVVVGQGSGVCFLVVVVGILGVKIHDYYVEEGQSASHMAGLPSVAGLFLIVSSVSVTGLAVLRYKYYFWKEHHTHCTPRGQFQSICSRVVINVYSSESFWSVTGRVFTTG